MLRLDDAGVPKNRYTNGIGVDALLVDEVFNVSGNVAKTLWAANDHQGSVRQLVDTAHVVQEHRDYDPFGEFAAVYDDSGTSKDLTTETLDSAFAFAGREWDDHADLYYNRARYYDPDTARFLGEDPALSDANLYRYAGNDPVNYRDPTGLFLDGYQGEEWYSSGSSLFSNPFWDSPFDLSNGASHPFALQLQIDPYQNVDVFDAANWSRQHNIDFQFDHTAFFSGNVTPHGLTPIDFQLQADQSIFLDYQGIDASATQRAIAQQLFGGSVVTTGGQLEFNGASAGLGSTNSAQFNQVPQSSSQIPPTLSAPPQTSFLENVWRGAVYGDFAEDAGWGGVVGTVGVGFIPVVGQLADARDIAAATANLGNGGWQNAGNWLGLGIALAAVIPGLDALKGVKNAGEEIIGLGKSDFIPELGQVSIAKDRGWTKAGLTQWDSDDICPRTRKLTQLADPNSYAQQQATAVRL